MASSQDGLTRTATLGTAEDNCPSHCAAASSGTKRLLPVNRLNPSASAPASSASSASGRLVIPQILISTARPVRLELNIAATSVREVRLPVQKPSLFGCDGLEHAHDRRCRGRKR